MKKHARIYVAGHRGLVGSAILRKLKEKGYTNLVYRTSQELDLRRQAEVEAFFEKERPEHVFLAAAKVGGILANNTYKAEFIYDNLMIAANVIHASYKYGVKKLLNLGSSCIYPKFCPQPMKEEYLLTGALEPTNEPYAIAKIAAIKLCRYYNEQYGTNFISVMPTNLYGPNDNFNLETAHVLPALIRKFHLAKLLRNGDYEAIFKDIKRFPLGFGYNSYPYKGEDRRESFIPTPTRGEARMGVFILSPSQGEVGRGYLEEIFSSLGITKDYVVLWGTGEPYREFLYVDDLADACVFLMERYDYEDIGEFVNIGTGEDIKIKDLVLTVKEVVGFEGEIRHDLTKPDGTPRKLLDISRIKALGWEPKIGLKEGIKKTYEWYLGQQGL